MTLGDPTASFKHNCDSYAAFIMAKVKGRKPSEFRECHSLWSFLMNVWDNK